MRSVAAKCWCFSSADTVTGDDRILERIGIGIEIVGNW